MPWITTSCCWVRPGLATLQESAELSSSSRSPGVASTVLLEVLVRLLVRVMVLDSPSGVPAHSIAPAGWAGGKEYSSASRVATIAPPPRARLGARPPRGPHCP